GTPSNERPRMISDDQGGFFLAAVVPNNAIVLQHFDSAATPAWMPPLSQVSSGPYDLAKDGLHGALLATQTNTNVTVERYDAISGPVWGTGRFSLGGTYGVPRITGDGLGGAFVVYRETSYGLRVQHVTATGAFVLPVPGLLVSDTSWSSRPGVVDDG